PGDEFEITLGRKHIRLKQLDADGEYSGNDDGE
ncbi:MAG: AbrB family transcriptional regulator, partial [Leptolyngbyaceae cyanobacterium SM2_3_12]|nr:AbrB family transcriptional regulator [Leptolyngbyaceae cyanobacterium SM2_3_12]